MDEKGILRRLQALERVPAPSLPRIHEVETVPPVGTLTSDVVTLHSADPLGVWLAPLQFHGAIEVSRASAVVGEHPGGPASSFGLAVYRLTDWGRYDRREPEAGGPLEYELIRALGTKSYGSAAVVRFDVTVDPPLVLSSDRGPWAIGVQGSDSNAKWYCPGRMGGALGSKITRRTYPLGERIGDFPRKLVTRDDTRPCPWVVLRSATGVRLFEYNAG